MTPQEIISHPAVQCSMLCHARRLALAAVAQEVAARSIAHVCEFGTYKGGSYSILRLAMPKHEIQVYDSWTGLSPATMEDGDQPFPEGACGTTLEQFNENIKDLHPRPLGVFAGKIDHRITLPRKVSLAFIDVDRYLPTAHVLLMLHYQNKMADGGAIVVDDYCPRFPGVMRAVDKFLMKNQSAQTQIVKGEPDDMIIIRL